LRTTSTGSPSITRRVDGSRKLMNAKTRTQKAMVPTARKAPVIE
jgi:hypothetical protein